MPATPAHDSTDREPDARRPRTGRAAAEAPPGAPRVGPAHRPASPVLAEVVRSDFVEGLHRGSLVILDADGTVRESLGDVASPILPRSANKPVQAAGTLRAGLELSGERLALAAASHSGEPRHLELVEKMLAEHDLTEADLQCPYDLPLDRTEAERHLAVGQRRSRVAMNCSGKHTAMLAACRANDWPLDTYLEPAHPLQRLIAETLRTLAGEPAAHTGTDGCGAPLLAVSLTGLARTFREFVRAPEDSPEGRVARAMRAHPAYVAGSRRHDTWLMTELPGTLSKMGAEAVQAVALPDGRALAFKLDDGAARALAPVLAGALRRLDVTGPVLDRLAEAPLWGGGQRVGEIRPAF
ncbi:asparaginase [Streptomyces oceani]|uniref:Asparaginase n=1 Tax=Streptomyces oceani TaxID=1075402 RepID=A0A1E7JF57_9ACTN|nr:asparaginase [Streptomyces oceani]OEU85102.1 asparaginase [Streptomyces oceani]